MLMQDCVLAVLPGATEADRLTLVRVTPDPAARVHCHSVCGLSRTDVGPALRLVQATDEGDVVTRPIAPRRAKAATARPHFELRQETFAEGLGWTVQSRIRLTGEQMRMLRGGPGAATMAAPVASPAV